MIVHERVVICSMARAYSCAIRPSRYSSIYFMVHLSPLVRLRSCLRCDFQLCQLVHLPQVLEDAVSLGFVDGADGEAYVHDDVVARFSLGHVSQAYLFHDAAEAD